ncbi:MAG: ABC transporter ATP-binding protein [Deltaproteobacteria bacterium]|nr:ABC transporter ATP-binding protein [Deltaproteobacteria bacterium]MBW2283528.1 ABC transporter ATP-binding protein [Deltaproteobacteria bacterium]
MLAVDDIHTYYGDSYVLQGVSLEVSSGEIATLLGRNGMGKTTLIRSVAGLTPPRKGTIRFREQSLGGLAPYQISQMGVALVPQGRRIFSTLTVRENLLVPTSKLAGGNTLGNNRSRRWDLAAVFEEFPQLSERGNQFGGSLSGGEQQMLAIGRALMANPDLVLMDEPSEGLAPVIVSQIGEIMQSIGRQGHSILLVEQNFGLAMDVADDVYVITSGRIVYHGTPVELKEETEILDRHMGI